MAKKSTKLKAIQETFKENNITSDTIGLNDNVIKEIKACAEYVQDYRHPSYTQHLLCDILMITFLQYLQMQMSGVKLKHLVKVKKNG